MKCGACRRIRKGVETSGKGCRKKCSGAWMENEMRSLYNNSAPKHARQGVHELKGCNCACRVQMIKLADGAEVGGFRGHSQRLAKTSKTL